MPKITLETLQSPIKPTWCPGCGNYGLFKALKDALVELELEEENVLLVYDVGCSGNMADFLRINGIHSLHGRTIPNAIGAKLANPELKVIVIAGDGGTYGEGVNHFLSACRGNHNITMIIHNNYLYSLTTGQASPTTPHGTRTKSTPEGLIEYPFNPLVMALEAHATFVSRGYVGRLPHLKEVLKSAIMHRGVSLVDVLQPCVTFNKSMSYDYFNKLVEEIRADHDITDKQQALELAKQTAKYNIGIFYKDDKTPAYHEQIQGVKYPLFRNFKETVNIDKLIMEAY